MLFIITVKCLYLFFSLYLLLMDLLSLTLFGIAGLENINSHDLKIML